MPTSANSLTLAATASRAIFRALFRTDLTVLASVDCSSALDFRVDFLVDVGSASAFLPDLFAAGVLAYFLVDFLLEASPCLSLTGVTMRALRLGVFFPFGETVVTGVTVGDRTTLMGTTFLARIGLMGLTAFAGAYEESKSGLLIPWRPNDKVNSILRQLQRAPQVW